MPFNTAPRPDHFIPRPAEIRQIIVALLTLGEQRTVAVTTTLQGGGGFGKTTLAQHVCNIWQIETAFPDGILWLEIGQLDPADKLYTLSFNLDFGSAK